MKYAQNIPAGKAGARVLLLAAACLLALMLAAMSPARAFAQDALASDVLPEDTQMLVKPQTVATPDAQQPGESQEIPAAEDAPESGTLVEGAAGAAGPVPAVEATPQVVAEAYAAGTTLLGSDGGASDNPAGADGPSTGSAAGTANDGAGSGSGSSADPDAPEGDDPSTDDGDAASPEDQGDVYAMLDAKGTTLVFDRFAKGEKPTIDGDSPLWYYQCAESDEADSGAEADAAAVAAAVPWNALAGSVQNVTFKCTVKPSTTQGWFANFAQLKQVGYGAGGALDMSRATSMASMFSGCSALSALDVSNWDVSRVTSINGAFQGCSSLTGLDVGKWDTSSMTDMAGAFQGCSALSSLDVSAWDTSNVTKMDRLFDGCTNLKTLDLASWDTGKVKDVNASFTRQVAGNTSGMTPREALTRYLLDHNQLDALLASLNGSGSGSGSTDASDGSDGSGSAGTGSAGGSSSADGSDDATGSSQTLAPSTTAAGSGKKAGSAFSGWMGSAGAAADFAASAYAQAGQDAGKGEAQAQKPAFGEADASTSIDSTLAPAASLSESVDNALDSIPADWYQLALICLAGLTIIVAVSAALLVPRRQSAAVR